MQSADDFSHGSDPIVILTGHHILPTGLLHTHAAEFINPEYFATIRENGVTLAQFVPRSEVNEYKSRYGDKIEFWEEVRDNGQVNRR